MKRLFVALLVIASLGGCATHWVVDNDVDAYSKVAAVPAGATYRFERLPSQQANEVAQQRLEAMVAPVLERAGLRRGNASDVRFSVQISARSDTALSPWADPWLVNGPWLGGGLGWRRGGFGGYGRFEAYGGFAGYGGYGGIPAASNPWYAREVGVVMRELPGGEVVFESHARNDGPYATSSDIFPAMFEAAMQGFPNPPTGVRRINVALTPAGARPQ